MSDDNIRDIPEVSFEFSKFMQETLKKEAANKPVTPTAAATEPYNPNKEYMKRYYETASGRTWVGCKPRYR